MTDKKPFDKEHPTKIPFEELIKLINQKCDYKFAIVDNEVDEELIALAKKEGVDLKGYKHVIEISGIRHSEKRHGKQSKDREPLSIEDYLLVPFIIRNRDKVSVSTSKSKRHKMNLLVYEKQIGLNYYWCHPTIATQGTHNGLFASSICEQSANKQHYRSLTWKAKLAYKKFLYLLR